MRAHTTSSATDRTAVGTAIDGGLARGLLGWLAAWRASRQSRLALRRLLDLDDRMLADIGLTRGDVELALSAPAGADPQAVLAECRANHLAPGRRAADRA